MPHDERLNTAAGAVHWTAPVLHAMPHAHCRRCRVCGLCATPGCTRDAPAHA